MTRTFSIIAINSQPYLDEVMQQSCATPLQIKISVPAKTMLCGEYDILTTGGQALAFALNSYLHVLFKIASQPSAQITIASDYWGHERIITASTTANDLLIMLVKELILPLHKVEFIEISSQYLPSYGFGSSSALILALQTAKAFIAKGCEGETLTRDALAVEEKHNLVCEARNLQLRFQGQASGYDIATQWHGGLLKFQTASTGELTLQTLPVPEHLCEFLHIYVGGKGAATLETLSTTSDWIQTENLHATIRKHTGELLVSFLQVLQRNGQNELSALIAAVAAWRQVFALSPCFPTHIAASLTSLQGCDKTWTFKTSGAGGEDALLLIGQHQHLELADQTLRAHGWHAVAYQPDLEGVRLEWVW